MRQSHLNKERTGTKKSSRGWGCRLCRLGGGPAGRVSLALSRLAGGPQLGARAIMPLASSFKRGVDHQHPWHISNVQAWNPNTDLRFGSLDKTRGGRQPRTDLYRPYIWVSDELESRNIPMSTLQDWKTVYGSNDPKSSPVLFRASKSHPQLANAHKRKEVANLGRGDSNLSLGQKDWLGKKMNSLSDWFDKFGRADESGHMMTSAVTRDREFDNRVDLSQEAFRKTSSRLRTETLKHHPMLYRAKVGEDFEFDEAQTNGASAELGGSIPRQGRIRTLPATMEGTHISEII